MLINIAIHKIPVCDFSKSHQAHARSLDAAAELAALPGAEEFHEVLVTWGPSGIASGCMSIP